MPRVLDTEASCCMARAPEKRQSEDILASSSVDREPITSKKLGQEDHCNGTLTIYHLTAKMLPLRVNDTFRLASSNLMMNADPTTTPKHHRCIPSLVDEIIHPKSATSEQAFWSSPNRNHSADELLSMERMDRLYKMRRRRRNLQRAHQYQEHARTFENEKENNVTQGIFLPTLDDDFLSDADSLSPSQFMLKPRLKHKAVLSERCRKKNFECSR